MALSTPARVHRSIIQPAPAMRQSLNKSLQVKPMLTLITHEYGTTAVLRKGASTDSAQIIRSGVQGEAPYHRFGNYLQGSKSDGYQVWRATNAANRIRPVVPPGQKATPIPASGLADSGNARSPMKGAAVGFNVSGDVALIALAAVAVILWRRR